MKWYECIGIGLVMGALFSVTLFASLQVQKAYYTALDQISLQPAFDLSPHSLQWNAPVVEVYNHTRLITPDPNMVYIPYEVTGVVMIAAFAILFSVPIWYPYAEQLLYKMAERDDKDE